MEISMDETRVLRKPQQVFVYNKTRETFLAFRVKVADSFFGRLMGLLGRRSLQPDSGVWIVPAKAAHTIGMMFSFDLVLIDTNFKVVGLHELVHPFTITRPNFSAESALGLAAHAIFRSRTRIGDQLLIGRYEAREVSRGIRHDRIGLQSLPLDIGSAGLSRPIVHTPQQKSRLDSRHLRLSEIKTR
jgi:uncharacterized protein